MEKPKDYWRHRRIGFYFALVSYVIIFTSIITVIKNIENVEKLKWCIIAFLGLCIFPTLIVSYYYITAILFDMKPNIVKFFHDKNKS